MGGGLGAARARGGDNTWAFGGGDGGFGRWFFSKFSFFYKKINKKPVWFLFASLDQKNFP